MEIERIINEFTNNSVMNDEELFKSLPLEIRNNKTVIRKLVFDNPEILKYVKEDIIKDIDFLIEIISINSNCIKYIDINTFLCHDFVVRIAESDILISILPYINDVVVDSSIYEEIISIGIKENIRVLGFIREKELFYKYLSEYIDNDSVNNVIDLADKAYDFWIENLYFTSYHSKWRVKLSSLESEKQEAFKRELTRGIICEFFRNEFVDITIIDGLNRHYCDPILIDAFKSIGFYYNYDNLKFIDNKLKIKMNITENLIIDEYNGDIIYEKNSKKRIKM